MEPTSSPSDDAVHVVVTGGDPIDPAVLRLVPPGACTIGVDSGIGHARALGLVVDVAVGDFDSVAPEDLAAVEDAGATVERHPAAKEATDLELGLHAAMARGARRVVVLGGHGGRLDHLLANALLLAGAPFAALTVEAHMGTASVTVAQPGRVTPVLAPVGGVVSLLPVGGTATDVTTAGLAYPLRREALAPGTTRGVSNVVADPAASVTLGGGTILVVVPGGAVPGRAVPGEPLSDEPVPSGHGEQSTSGLDADREPGS